MSRTEADAIAEIARTEKIVDVRQVTDDDGKLLVERLIGRNEHGFAAVLETVDVERHRHRPVSKRGTVHVHTPQSLVAYVDRHLDPDESTLWGDVNGHTVTVVLNDHVSGDDVAGWADHRAVLTLERSWEWKAWTAHNEDDLSQVGLAEFLEEHVNEIVEPDGATILEVAQTLHATKGANFKSAVALQSGEQQLVWEEQVDAKAGHSGTTEIPRRFTVALRPFVGTDPVRVEASFRFRIRDGRLSLGYRLLGLEEITRTAVEQVLTEVADQTELVALEGAAPTARR